MTVGDVEGQKCKTNPLLSVGSYPTKGESRVAARFHCGLIRLNM
jgi:hypothetical protein